ncbi:hypothetical protein HOY82DRAFT_592055 [Tuber indicum]|nr:hypothetical protein HOY82DRAFT_592055 [Tuber indicum]
MSKSDSAQTKEILQDGSRNDQGSVIARGLKVITPNSEPSASNRLWFDIRESRGLDGNGSDRANFTETVDMEELKKLSPVTGCNQLQTRIMKSLDTDGRPDSSRSESPGFENHSSSRFPGSEITGSDKGHGEVGAWGAKIGSVLAMPMKRIGPRKKSVDSRKSAQSGLDAFERERSPSRAYPSIFSDGHDISIGGVRSSRLTRTNPDETLHDRQPSPRGETHYPAFQDARDDSLGSPVRSPHQPPPAQGQSRMCPAFPKYSDKIATWGTSPGIESDHQSKPFSEKFSSLDPPKRYKSRINRPPRTEHGNDTEDLVSPGAFRDEGANISPGSSHKAILSASTDPEQPGPTKPGFMRNLTKKVNSARKQMSLPFIFGSDVAAVYSPLKTLSPGAVPPEPPRRIESTPSDLPGSFFLPSKAKSAPASTAAPHLELDRVTQEWTLQDFRDMNLIQPSPLGFPRYENSQPPPPPKTKNPVKSPRPLHTPSIAPKINVAAPFESYEYVPEMEVRGGIPKAPGISREITTHHENPCPEDPRDRPKPSTDTGDLYASAALQGISAPPGGKPIELQEEEERRNRRDSRVMGLNPETMPADDRLAGQADEDGRRDTYGAAIREIAGLDLTLRGPPALHSNNLGNVSGPSSNVNNFLSPAFQLTSNDEPAVAFPATFPPDSSKSETMAVARSQPYSPFSRPSVISASNVLTTQYTITPAFTTVSAISIIHHLSYSSIYQCSGG